MMAPLDTRTSDRRQAEPGLTRRAVVSAAMAFAAFSPGWASTRLARKRVLIIVTSQAEATPSGKPTGLWFSEMTDPYWVFRDTGLGVDIASIRGGEPPIDPRSMSGSRGSGPLVRRFQADAKAMEAFRSTPELGSVDASSYDALFLAGGHGTMWDFPSSLPLNRTLTRAFRANRVVAAVCHGPAGLLGITDARGEPVIKGRRVTGFTNAEEQAVQLTSVVPFLLEDAMKAKGARFVAGPDFEPHVLQDRYLITGQNPRSAEPAAQLVVQALSRCSALQAPVR